MFSFQKLYIFVTSSDWRYGYFTAITYCIGSVILCGFSVLRTYPNSETCRTWRPGSSRPKAALCVLAIPQSGKESSPAAQKRKMPQEQRRGFSLSELVWAVITG